MAGRYKYDVFLSHNSDDKDPVEWIAQRLLEDGLAPFLDRWHLVPGEPWQEAIEHALGDSLSVAVFLGPTGISPWHNEEMRAALEQRVSDPAFRLIPVLLPGATMPEKGRLPPFLARRTWVDFRKSLEDLEPLRQLVGGVRGFAPGPRLIDSVQFGDQSPYLGLEKFQPRDAPWFFGRESETQQLVERLKSTRFLAVIGASGSGKSSLVLAGLVPALQKDALPGSAGWPFRIFTPTAQPLEELAINLASLLPDKSASDLLRELEKEQRALHFAVRQGLADSPSERKILLVVDQFEEAFTLCRSDTVRQNFFNNLLYAAEQEGGRTVIVLTMRADFIAKAANYTGLADKLSSFQFIVTPLEKEQLRQVIERPAAIAGLQLDDGLTEQILDDVSNQPGGLPLLEHALFELWKLRQENRLTFAAYSEIGRVAGALARTADDTYESLNEGQREIARRILLELVQPGEGTEDTRRRALGSELVSRPDEVEAVETVLQRLADQRLVTINRELINKDAVVNVAHEALIRNWPVLQGWINENRESLRFQRKLREAVEEWQANLSGGDFLWGGSRLAQLKEWAADHDDEINESERRFLAASVTREQAERDRELAEQEAKRRAATLRQRSIYLTVALFLVLLVAITTGLLLNETRKSRNEIAELGSQTRANLLSVDALTNMDKKIDLSLLLAVEAFAERDMETTRNSLRTVLEYSPNLKKIIKIIRDPVGKIYSVSYSGDGKLIAIGGSNHIIQLLDAQTFQPVGEPLDGLSGAIRDLTFSPDGRFLASASEDKNVILWDLKSPGDKSLELISGSGSTHNNAATQAIFSPDSDAVLTAGFDKTFRLWKDLDKRWNGDNPTFEAEEEEEEAIFSLAWQPGGNLLVVGSGDSSIDLWEISLPDFSLKHLREKPGKTNIGAIRDLAFSPDGKFLVAAGNNSIIRYWGVESILNPDPNLKKNQFQLGEELGRHQLRVNSLAFSPDGRYLVSAGSDKMIILWDFEKRLEIARLVGHQLGVGSVAFSPDGNTILSGSDDEQLMVWEALPEPLDIDHPESWIQRACQVASRLLTPGELDTYFRDQEHEQTCKRFLETNEP